MIIALNYSLLYDTKKLTKMAPKKRKLSQCTNESREDEPSPCPTPVIKKRRRLPATPQEMMGDLYETIRNHKMEDGRLMCEVFVRVPKRRTDPEYYNLVSQPIDLLKIQHKMKSEEYDNVEQMTADISLLVENAKIFYKDTSQEHADACYLWSLYNDTKTEILTEIAGEAVDEAFKGSPVPEGVDCDFVADDDWDSEKNEEDRGSQSEMEEDDASKERDKDLDRDEDEESACEQMFTAVVTATDGGRCLSDMFKILPSRKKYPDYYEIIKDPIDMKTIAQRIQANQYATLDDMIRDLNIMVHNARTFNEPGSQIYRDAVTVRKIVQNKKHELEQPRPQRPVRSERIRLRKLGGDQKLSAVIAALQNDPDPEEDPLLPEPVMMEADEESGAELEGSIVELEDDPLWNLYLTVKNHKNSLGQRMSEPFLKLPSKRIYPDYYEEIKKPMSLLKIQKRLKNGQYRDLDHLANDMNLVFENAKHYNIDESKLFKDAVRLQGLMRTRKKELQESKDELWEHASEISKKSRRSLETSSTTSEESTKRPKAARKSLSPEELVKKRLWMLYRTVYDYQEDSRSLIDIFVLLPSKKDYPDYYQVISEPIDMTMIENKIKIDKYTDEQALISDFELMFKNARHYNEDGSQVYKDAEMLEKVLVQKVRSLPLLDGSPLCHKMGKNRPKVRSTTSLPARLQDMYNTIRDHMDPRGRILSTPFMKLPLKSEYPDYYEVIKKPIDMQKIFQRMMGSQYGSVEDMVSDMVLMFDNACKYNEPDSLIYKDALTLQRVCLEKKQELCADDDSNDIPDVRAQVQELMTNLFISTYNHMDEEGRCFSDSFMELPKNLPVEDTEEMDFTGEPTAPKEKRAPTFEQIKRNVDMGRYRRLDKFQEDMFKVFEFARKVSRTDSQVFEDSIELQMFFMKIRDELCKNGEILLSPSLSYTEAHFQRTLDSEKKEKSPREQREDEEKKKHQEGDRDDKKDDDDKDGDESKANDGKATSLEYDGEVFNIGDFVYIEAREKGMDSHVVCIEKLWKEESGEMWLYGCWFLRPNETYHVATRKFLEKEVFKSDFYDQVPLGKVVGKCFVMSVKDYFKLKPEGFHDSDVFVCESRYSGRHKMFKKIKIWQLPKNELVQLEQRETLLVPVRVASVFADKSGSEDRALDEGQPDFLDIEQEEVTLNLNTEDGLTYYEQYKAPSCYIKLGDFVYVRSDMDDRPLIACVDKIWCGRGKREVYFHGPYFIPPSEVEHPPTRLFYHREVFRSSIEDTNATSAITGRCAVLSYKEYCTSRPTEIPEKDTYICESKYLEAEKLIKKFAKPMKKPNVSLKVCDDEICFFRKPVTPNKEPSPFLMKVADESCYQEGIGENSFFDASLNEGSVAEPPIVETPVQEPASEKKKKVKSKARNVSGYIVFAAEYRKEITAENPDLSFGEISKVVGTKWKSLPLDMKAKYEDKARKQAEEHAAKQAEADKAFNEALGTQPPPPAGYQHGHYPPPQGFQQQGYQQGQYPPPQEAGAYPPHQHQAGMHPHQYGQGQTPTPGTSQQSTPMAPPPPPPKPPSPMFVPVPPRTQRLVHSEAYLRYIEGLTPENKTVGNWEKSMAATSDNTPLSNSGKLPIHWLANGVGQHENAASALWALRDLMMKDALMVSRTLEFNQL